MCQKTSAYITLEARLKEKVFGDFVKGKEKEGLLVRWTVFNEAMD